MTTFSLTRTALIGLATGSLSLPAALGDRTVVVEGDPTALGRLVGLLTVVDPEFNIVTA